VAHRGFKALTAEDLCRKVVKGGVFVDVKAAHDADALRGVGLRVWRL
jgi:UDP-N-acetyl-D-galactosamine dehydrogenase